jgi:hypothetical protein
MSDARVSYLTVSEMFKLHAACVTLFDTFDSPPYLVGSSLVHKDYRDVDIRMILPDPDFARMFGNHYWLALANATISEWLKIATSLPIDFQFQSVT